MAAGWYTVALKNKLTSMDGNYVGFNVSVRNEIAYKIFDYFVAVRDASNSKGVLRVQAGFTHTAAALSNYDLVCYFVRDQSQSIIAKLGGSASGDQAGGTAVINGRTISEVYVEYNFPALKLANICFHELMHNKLAMGNTALHRSGRGLNQSPTTAEQKLTTDNLRAMANRLTYPVAQYTSAM